MKVQKLIKIISSLDKDKQQELGELYAVLEVLYKKYGERLAKKEMINSIRVEAPDLAILTESLVRDCGLEELPQIIHYFQKHVNKPTLQVSSPMSHASIESRLHHIIDGVHIQSHQSDQLGVKIKSYTGQRYERTINKDIEKLQR